MVFFEIPVIFIVFIILSILGMKIGTAVIVTGVVSLILAIFMMISEIVEDDDILHGILLYGLLWVLPSILIIIWGISIGDKPFWQVISDIFSIL